MCLQERSQQRGTACLGRLSRSSVAPSETLEVEDVDATLGASDAADVEEDDGGDDDADSDEDEVTSKATGACKLVMRGLLVAADPAQVQLAKYAVMSASSLSQILT